MTDTERLDAIIYNVQRILGDGWWWHVMHDIHAAPYRGDKRTPREIIDARLPNVMGMKVVADPTVPADEVRVMQDGVEVGRIINLKAE